MIDEFEQFLIEVDAEIISIEDISPTRVFEKYFGAKPPFSHKKKSEFPDAFSLEAILKWLRKVYIDENN